MTTIKIGKSPDGAYKQIICSGHAGFAGRKDSYDVVCASVSVLVINTINALEELAGETFKTASIRCDFETPLQERSVFLLDAMVYGLENIEKQYGKKYLQVDFEEV